MVWRFLLLCLCACTLAPAVFAQTETLRGPIVRFEVTGLKRTRPSVVQKTLDPFVGKEAATLDLREVHAAIVDTGILHPQKIELRASDEETGVVLYAELVEKWSLFPLPFFALDSSGNIMAGGFIADMNAFGLNDKFAAGGMYRTGGAMAMLFYTHNAQRKALPNLSLGAIYSDDTHKITNKRNSTLRRWDSREIHSFLRFTYPLRAGRLNLSTGFAFDKTILDTGQDDLSSPDQAATRLSLIPQIRYQKKGFDGLSMIDRYLSLSCDISFGFDCRNVYKTELDGLWEWSLIPGLKMRARANAAYVWEADEWTLTHPNRAASILPGSFGAYAFAGARAGVEKHLFGWKYASVSIGAEYQAIENKDSLGEWDFDHGPAANLSVYLARIALPAVSVVCAYNVARDYFSTSFSVGMSF